MFWKKKASSSTPVERTASTSPTPADPPKPILRMNTEGQGSSSIRFAGQKGYPRSPASTSTSTTLPPIHADSMPLGQSPTSTSAHIRGHPPAPRVVVSSYDSYPPSGQARPLPHQRMTSYGSAPLNPLPRVSSSRRSSRPTSPSSTSFGARIRSSTEPIMTVASSSSSSPFANVPLGTPPLSSSHVTTPPTAYVSTFQNRAPPPPSPYRPTNERRRSSLTRNLPEQLPKMGDFAPASHAQAHAQTQVLLGASDSRASLHTLPGADVPMLNIIPATPQDHGEGFPDVWSPRASASDGEVDRRTAPLCSKGLEEAVQLEDMVPVPLGPLGDIPSIDVNLEFSPFEPLAELPDTDSSMHELPAFMQSGSREFGRADYEDDCGELVEQRGGEDDDEEEEEEEEGREHEHEHAPLDPLPPSPPFVSYPSLPSLASQESIRSSESDDSMPTSSSTSSLVSFPDVEEALGSMLASLSDSSMSSASAAMPATVKELTVSSMGLTMNPGLGLGLDLAEKPSITAPLSPRRRAPPAPLDLSKAKYNMNVERGIAQTAPIINHRVAFYGTARAHPRSPSSGIFTSCSSLASAASSSSSSSSTSTISLNEEGPRQRQRQSQAGSGDADADARGQHDTYRDSISLASEASDEDLYTASIISLTPVMKGKVGVREVREIKEEILGEGQDGTNGLGLGLGLGLGPRGGTGFGMGHSTLSPSGLEDEVEVGLAL
ncbi:hypothetical protein IAU60_006563 [Kwoniella sp. DSM 27419]